MNWVLDIAVILIIAILTVIGIKRGAISEIVSLVGVVVAIVLSFMISKPAAVFVYDNMIEESIYNSVYEAIDGKVSSDVNATVDALPEEIIEASESVGFDITAEFEKAFKTDGNISEIAAEKITNSIARPLLINVIRIIIFMILFIILKLLINWLGRVLNIVSKLPIIGTANTLIGGIIGFIRGIIIALIICYVVIIILNVRPEGMFGITSETAQNTKLFSLLSGIFG